MLKDITLRQDLVIEGLVIFQLGGDRDCEESASRSGPHVADSMTLSTLDLNVRELEGC